MKIRNLGAMSLDSKTKTKYLTLVRKKKHQIDSKAISSHGQRGGFQKRRAEISWPASCECRRPTIFGLMAAVTERSCSWTAQLGDDSGDESFR
jgi:hypothetical protein